MSATTTPRLIRVTVAGGLLLLGGLLGGCNAPDMSPQLHKALTSKDTAGVRAVVTADPKQANSRRPDGMPAIYYATVKRHKAGVKALLAAGANVNAPFDATESDSADGWTALHRAAHDGQLAIVRVLLTAGGDPSIKGKDGMSATDVGQRACRQAAADDPEAEPIQLSACILAKILK